MKTSTTLIALAFAAVIPFSVATAGEGKEKSGTMSPAFDKLDTNRDGRISQAEASMDANIVFTSADANGDGYLDKSEWKTREKGSSSPAPQSAPEPAVDPTVPQASDPAPADSETPRQ